MLSQKEPLPAVTAAGVVAIILSLFGLCGSLLTGLSMMVMPEMQTTPGAPPMPPETRSMMAGMMLFMFALSVFGIFVGAGVIRRKNWARITMLIWGGFMTFVGVCAVAFSFLIFSMMPGLDLPNARQADMGHVMQFVRIFLVLFYGIPAGVGIWWMILFSRKRVATAFTNPAESVYPPTMDASGFPQLPDASPTQQRPKRASCPLPLAIVAGLQIFGAAFLILFAFISLPSGIPYFFFGHAFGSAVGKLIFIVFGLVSCIAGVGIFKLKPWALHTEIGFQFVGLLNCMVTFFSPNYLPAMRSAMSRMYSQNPVLAGNSPFLSDTYLRFNMILVIVLLSAVLGILLWQRSRFLEQAAAAVPKS